MIHLELPNIKYKSTYISAVKEYQAKGSDRGATDHYLKLDISELNSQFDKFVNPLLDYHKGLNLKGGWVPYTEFWIIDENQKYCGRISLRHKLNEALLKHGGHIGYDIVPSERGKRYASKALELCLKEAKKIGIREALLTCDDDNVPSIKTIETNGGILRDKMKNQDVLTRYYIIQVD